MATKTDSGPEGDYHEDDRQSRKEPEEPQIGDSDTRGTRLPAGSGGVAVQQQLGQPKLEGEQTGTTSPAYVAPIPTIGHIPPVTLGSGSARRKLSERAGSLLVGKRIDEYGDVVDETGRVLARASGDLPSIVGRAVANPQGDIFGDDGELLGRVVAADDDVDVGPEAGESPPPRPRSLADVMRRSSLPLLVDTLGNILDSDGKVVGRFHDNNNPLHREAAAENRRTREPREGDAPAAPGTEEETTQAPPTGTEGQRPEKLETEEQSECRRPNAQSWRKENESPSDIFLDVKSTTEGIQLTIRIPTVFNGAQS